MPAPLINGISYSWGQIKFAPFGVPMVGITAISYNRKQKKDNNYGAGTLPVSRGYGNEEYEASISVYTEEWKAIIAASVNRNPLQIPWFDIPVIYGNDPSNLATDILQAVEFLEDPFDSKQNDTSIIVRIPLIVGGIKR